MVTQYFKEAMEGRMVHLRDSQCLLSEDTLSLLTQLLEREGVRRLFLFVCLFILLYTSINFVFYVNCLCFHTLFFYYYKYRPIYICCLVTSKKNSIVS